MKAIIKTNNRNLFYSLLDFLRTIPVSVETTDDSTVKVESKSVLSKPKKFNPSEYEGIISHLNLDLETELKNMRKGWKKSF